MARGDDQVGLGAAAVAEQVAQASELDGQKPRAEGEVLLEQPVPLEGAGVVGQQLLAGVEPDRPQRGRPPRRSPAAAAADRVDDHARRVGQQLLVQPQLELRRQVQVDRQPVQRQGVQRLVVGSSQAKDDGRLGPRTVAGTLPRPQAQRRHLAGVPGVGDLQRPERHGVGRGVDARRAADGRRGDDLAAPVDRRLARPQGRLGGGDELDHRHRRRRRQVVRADDLEDLLGEPRELRLELQVDAGRQVREPLQQPFDERVVAPVGLDPQVGRVGVALGERIAQLADVVQLRQVMVGQPVIHRPLPPPSTTRPRHEDHRELWCRPPRS